MGQVTQIATELKQLIQKQMDEQDSDDYDEEDPDSVTVETVIKKHELQNWMVFCKQRINKIEKVWNRKLEDDRSDSDDDDSDDKMATGSGVEDDSSLTHDDFLDRLLSKGQSRVESRSHVDFSKRDDDYESLQQAAEEARQGAKDDSEIEHPGFHNNNYWRMDSEHQIADLMAELD